MIYLCLFWEFLKIGMFTVGGGMATLPFLYDLSSKTGWFTASQIADMLAVSESTPGPMGINMATYVGYTVGGITGAILASLALITPGVILVLLILRVLDKFRSNKYVDGAFYGLRAASIGLITAAGLMVMKLTFILEGKELSGASAFFSAINYKAIILAAVLIYLTRFFKPTKKLHPIVFIAFSALVGIVFGF